MDTPALSRGLTRPCRPAPAPASLLAALPLTRPPPARPSLGSPPARPGVPRLHRPAGPSPLARSAVAAPGIQPPRAWTRPRCRQASSAFPPMPAPASAPLSLPAARPPAPSPPTRPVPLARLCLACIAQPAHRPRTPLPSRSGAPRPRADSHAPAASALRAFRPTPAPAFRRAVRACAARSPGALASSRSPRPARLVPLARLCPLHRSAACPHTPPFPRPSSLPALIDAPAPSLGCHARTTADACISLRTCTPACRPAHPLAARSRARTVAFVRLCPSGTATLAQRPLAHPDFAAPRTAYPVPIDAPALPLVFTRAFRPTPASAPLSRPAARPLAPSPPNRRAQPSRLPLPLARLRLACAASLPTASSHTPPLPCPATPRAHGLARAAFELHAPVPADACTCMPACRPAAHALGAHSPRSPGALVPSRLPDLAPPARPRWPAARSHAPPMPPRGILPPRPWTRPLSLASRARPGRPPYLHPFIPPGLAPSPTTRRPPVALPTPLAPSCPACTAPPRATPSRTPPLPPPGAPGYPRKRASRKAANDVTRRPRPQPAPPPVARLPSPLCAAHGRGDGADDRRGIDPRRAVVDAAAALRPRVRGRRRRRDLVGRRDHLRPVPDPRDDPRHHPRAADIGAAGGRRVDAD